MNQRDEDEDCKDAYGGLTAPWAGTLGIGQHVAGACVAIAVGGAGALVGRAWCGVARYLALKNRIFSARAALQILAIPPGIAAVCALP